ncbi:MAG: putative ABC transporter permease subunit [Candidatus Sumerlaeaceae bacterium]
MRHVKTILGAKWIMLDNIVRSIRSHLWVHVAAGIFTLVLLITFGGVLFWEMFRYLLTLEPFGAPLMERLVGIVLLAFFSMLTFSNLIITLTTTYISKETEFLLGYPLPYRTVFSIKLAESIFYSSWAFVLLSVPLFTAYGIAKKANLGFYPAAIFLGLPFLVIPAALGAFITMLLSAYLPAKRARVYSIGLLLGALAVTGGLVRMMGLRTLLRNADTQEFGQIMSMLNVGNVPLLPNYWLARGMQSASSGHWLETGYWWLMLASTACMMVQVCLWLVPALYYRGWSLAKEGASATTTVAGWSPFPLLDRVMGVFTRPVAALIGKDMRTFWRDPSQWSQLVILFGLLIIYVANIRGLTRELAALENLFRQWPTILSFFNLGATCFVVCILTTRFIYPMLSLEGKQYWVVGLAPFPKRKLIWEKYGLCLTIAVGLAAVLIIFSNYMLQVRLALAWISVTTVLIMGVGLTSLAVGLGATFPDFRQDNPARIANGLGGTANIVFSLFYIGGNIGLELPPTFVLIQQLQEGAPFWLAAREALRVMWPCFLGFVVLNGLVIYLPMRVGIRRWENLEFHL